MPKLSRGTKLKMSIWENVSITIAIPLFNRLELLKRTVESVFNQTVPPNEFIIVDNGSTDGSYEYALSLKNRGVQIFRNRTNLGMIGNWNECIKKAKSKYVVVLGSDDIILPNYISTWKKKIAKVDRQNVAAFFSGGYIIDGNDKIKGIYKPFNADLLLKPPRSLRFLWENLHLYLSTTGWTVYDRHILEKLGYYRKKYEIAAENDLTVRILPRFPVFYSKDVNFAFRRHGLQGFDKKVKNFDFTQERENIENGLRVYLDFEKDESIAKSFSQKEQKLRLIVRIPASYYLVFSLLSYFVGDKRAKGYLDIFLKFYPKPIFTPMTLRLGLKWFEKIFREYLRNFYVRLGMRNRTIQDYFATLP
ncbi:hypothetical protein A2115_01540 [Candidatus Woesebacteria bacterium GWA1_41_8]|uniref:Glycosyltransferase 2-like domain-containing protein n=1 Tax=Candidatus Woesebacteria bacterium GWA1_41_8 TaxID=1802471 RepID=A0A1F7WH64_9BACT|nr:MAG: hypothetical protein A2115_01540 [Candidatus Woesebacteria bacterium GWA1_41_8]